MLSDLYLKVILNKNRIRRSILVFRTSSTSLGLRFCTSKAFKIGGKSSSNCTSTTAPITATTFPFAAPEAALAANPLSSNTKKVAFLIE